MELPAQELLGLGLGPVVVSHAAAQQVENQLLLFLGGARIVRQLAPATGFASARDGDAALGHLLPQGATDGAQLHSAQVFAALDREAQLGCGFEDQRLLELSQRFG